MAFGVTGAKGGNGGVSQASITINISAVVGNLILVFGSSRVTTWAATPVTDSLGNTYNQVYSTASTTASVSRQLCYWVVSTGTVTSVTLTRSAAATNGFSGVPIVITGAAASNPVDVSVSAGASASGTALASGTSAASLATTSEAIFGCGTLGIGAAPTWSAQAFGGTAAAYSGQTDLEQQFDSNSATDVFWGLVSGSTLGTIAFSETSSASGGWVCGAVSIKPAVVTDTYPPKLHNNAYLAM